MGLRNPYTIAIDPATGHLFYGDIGPDAGESDELRGARGYDEINRITGPATSDGRCSSVTTGHTAIMTSPAGRRVNCSIRGRRSTIPRATPARVICRLRIRH